MRDRAAEKAARDEAARVVERWDATLAAGSAKAALHEAVSASPEGRSVD